MKKRENNILKSRINIYHRRFIILKLKRKVNLFVLTMIAVSMIVFIALSCLYLYYICYVIKMKFEYISLVASMLTAGLIFICGYFSQYHMYIENSYKEIFELCSFLEEHGVATKEEKEMLDKLF